MKLLPASIIFLSATLSAPLLRAQQVDAYLGLGTARASSSGQSFNTFGDGTLYPTPALGGIFPDFGLTVFLDQQLGVGWTAAWRSAHNYAGLQYRPLFNTFDAVFQPIKLRRGRSVPEFRAGLGLSSIHFDYDDPANCAAVPGCPSSHHFIAHAGIASRFYLTQHVFIRPALDLQFVNHFSPFGSNWVPRYSMSAGYSFGRP